MSREDIEEAIEVLEDASADMLMETGYKNYYIEAIAVLRQALETEQEPVAWANSSDLQNFDMRVRTGPDLHHTVPLYTAPPKREWVGLTDEDLFDIAIVNFGEPDLQLFIEMGKLVQEELKEKNT